MAHALASFCVISHKSHLHRHGSCRTRYAHGMTAFLFHLRTTLHLCIILCTGVSPAIRNMAFSLAVLPNRAPLQVVSPTIPSRLAVRRLRLCSNHREEQVLGRLTTRARTLPLPHASSEVDERSNLGMLASPLLSQKREASAAQSRQVHYTFQPVQGHQWRCTHTRESQVEIQMFYRSLFPREKRIFTEHRDICDFLELQADHAA